MRLLAIVAVLFVQVERSSACILPDRTEVWAGFVDPLPDALWALAPIPYGSFHVVPSRPSVLIHIGADDPPGLPEFIAADGSSIPYDASPLVMGEQRLLRANLNVDEGVILIRYPGRGGTTKALIVDPSLRPATRSVDVDEYAPNRTWVNIQSDAIAFLIELDHDPVPMVGINPGAELSDGIRGSVARIIAIYGDRTEQVIYTRARRRLPSARKLPAAAAPETCAPLMRIAGLLLLGVAGMCVRRRRVPEPQ